MGGGRGVLEREGFEEEEGQVEDFGFRLRSSSLMDVPGGSCTKPRMPKRETNSPELV